MTKNEIYEKLLNLRTQLEEHYPLDEAGKALLWDVCMHLGLTKEQADEVARDIVDEPVYSVCYKHPSGKWIERISGLTWVQAWNIADTLWTPERDHIICKDGERPN